jgi:hypothetical protein
MVEPAWPVPAARVAVAVPVASVVACTTVMLPALDEKVTVTPLTTALAESFATTVTVADADPSEGIDATLLDTVRVAAVVPVAGPEVQVPVVVLPPPVPPLSLLQPLSLPPQPAIASVMTSRAVIDANVRIFLSLNLKLSADAVRINTH